MRGSALAIRCTYHPIVEIYSAISTLSGAHGGGWEGLGEDGMETALYHIAKENRGSSIVTLEGELTSPFQRSLALSHSLPPLLGLGINPRPATKGAYPLGSHRLSVPRGKPRFTDRRS